MKKKHNEGFSLVEVLVAIVILGIFVVPTCSSLIMTFQMNQKTAQMLKAQQAVSSAVEELKATGINGTGDLQNKYPNLEITATKSGGQTDIPYYNVKVTCDNIVVETVIRDSQKTGGGS